MRTMVLSQTRWVFQGAETETHPPERDGPRYLFRCQDKHGLQNVSSQVFAESGLICYKSVPWMMIVL